MRTNKKVWKLVSVVLALAMVVGLMPSGLIMKNTTVKAATVDLFGSNYDAYSLDNWTWGDNWGWYGAGNDYYGSSFSGKNTTAEGAAYYVWNGYNGGASSGAMYYTFSSLSAGTYTLSCTLAESSYSNSTNGFSLYPYINGSQVSTTTSGEYISSGGADWSNSRNYSSYSSSTLSYTFTLDSAVTNYSVGFYGTAENGAYWYTDWSLLYTAADDSGDDNGDDNGDDDDDTTTTTRASVVTWDSSGVPGDFETTNSILTTSTLSSLDTVQSTFADGSSMFAYGTNTTKDTTTSYNHTEDAAYGYSARMDFVGVGTSDYNSNTNTLYVNQNKSPTSTRTFTTSTGAESYTLTSDWTEYTYELYTSYDEDTGTLTFTGPSSSNTAYIVHIGVFRSGTAMSILNAYINPDSLDLSDYSGETLYLSFYAKYVDGSTDYVYVDDVDVWYSAEAKPITIGSSSDGYEEYALGTNYADWTGTNISRDTWAYSGGSISSYTWTYNDKQYVMTFEGSSTGYMYYTGSKYYLTAGTYNIEAMYIADDGSNLYPAIFDTNGNVLASYADSLTTETVNSSGWNTSQLCKWSFELDEDSDAIGQECYVGFVYAGSSSSSWANISTIVWKYATSDDVVEVVRVGNPEDTYTDDDGETQYYSEYAVGTKYSSLSGIGFGSGWVFSGTSAAYVTSGSNTYYWVEGMYFWTSAWDYDESNSIDQSAESENLYYYNQPFSFQEGEYKVGAYLAIENATVYPAIYDTSGNVVASFPDSASEDNTENSDWNTDTYEWIFTLDDSYASGEYYIGFVYEADTDNIDNAWASMTNVVWKYATDSDNALLYGTNNVYNKNFETGNANGWYGGEDGSSILEEGDTSDAGYTVTDDSANGSYVFSAWNNSSSEYTITMVGFANFTTEGEYYLVYKNQGVNNNNSSVTINVSSTEDTVKDIDPADTNLSGDDVEVTFSGAWASVNEYICDTENCESVLLEDAESFDWDSVAPITVNSAGMVKVTITITLSGGDWINLDDIQFVTSDYTGTVSTTDYLAYNNFENGDFGTADDSTWLINEYWTAKLDGSTVTQVNETNLGFKIADKDEWAGEEYTGTDLMVAGWSNYDEDSGEGKTHTATLSQKIMMEETGTYYISVDSCSYLASADGTESMTITVESATRTQNVDDDGNVYYTYTVGDTLLSATDICNNDTTSWDTMKTGTFTIDAENTVIIVTVTIVMGSCYDEDGEYSVNSSFALDNFYIYPYIVNEYTGNGENEWYAVYNSSAGSYVNGANYVKGVDISSVIALEAAGTTYTGDGTTDLFRILKDAGVNSIRIRVWVNPKSSTGDIYGGGMNDESVAVMIAQRAADVGLGVMLSFHLSDFWADPGQQILPKSWTNSVSQIASEAASHVQETVEAVLATGVDLQFVTVGNEVTNTSGIANYSTDGKNGQMTRSISDMYTILKEAAAAVDTAAENSGLNTNDIMVGLHTASNITLSYAFQMFSTMNSSEKLSNNFDFLATSFYPYWSGYSDVSSGGNAYTALYTTLIDNLKSAVSSYGLPVMVAEVKWPWSITGDYDGSIYGTDVDSSMSEYYWDVSESGQEEFLEDFSEALGQTFGQDASSTYKGMYIGSYYWEPAWIGAGNITGWTYNALSLWKEYGCGEATYAGALYAYGSSTASTNEYSSDGSTGSATDQLTLFTNTGVPTGALNALNYMSDTMPITASKTQVSTVATGSSNGTDTYSLRYVGLVVLSDDDVSGETYADSSKRTYFDKLGFKYEYSLDSDNDGSYDNLKTMGVLTTTNIYKSIIAGGTTYDADDYYESLGGTLDDGEHAYFYTYIITGIPYTDSGTYYFKLITTAYGTYNYQQETHYYSLTFCSSSPVLTAINAWDYTGSNDNYTSSIMDSYELYPSSMQK